ncbi:hypothetical protein NOR93_29310, partial [Klebsiella pneumoniae]|uniref:hypothetical protein n=1 Tax=Klebsiella pneumoniae TaxID=573 RepID=UPI003EDBCAB2
CLPSFVSTLLPLPVRNCFASMFTYYFPNKVVVNSVKAFAPKARSPLSVISVRTSRVSTVSAQSCNEQQPQGK